MVVSAAAIGKGVHLRSFISDILIVDVAIPFLRPLLQSNRSMQQYHTGELADNILMVMGSECCVYHGDVGGAMPKFRWRREMKKLRD